MKKHSATPFRPDAGFVETASGELVCRFRDGFGPLFENAEENAEFIVRAVNSHQALVEALELMAHLAARGELATRVQNEQARAALSLARGKK